MLYAKNGRVYIAGRSADKAEKAISAIRASAPSATGTVSFIHLALDDLTTIKTTVDQFKTKETKLHVLWNNAGVSQPPAGSKSKQSFELQLATNCLGPFLLTKFLLPCLSPLHPKRPKRVSQTRFGLCGPPVRWWSWLPLPKASSYQNWPTHQRTEPEPTTTPRREAYSLRRNLPGERIKRGVSSAWL